MALSSWRSGLKIALWNEEDSNSDSSVQNAF